MGNEFSDIAYGSTESEACLGLISGLRAIYPKIMQIDVLDADKTPLKNLDIPRYLQITPYGLYRLEYVPVNGQILAKINYE